MVEEDHEIMVQTLEKPNADIFLVPAWFFPLIVACADNLPQRGNTKGLVLLQMADKEGSMGEGLKIFQGGAIPGPGEGVRRRVMVASAYANGVFIFLAIKLRPLETVDGSKASVHSSTQFFVPIVGLRDEGHVWQSENH